MKAIKTFILEGLKIGSKSKVNQKHYYPKDKDELEELIIKLIKERGNEANLNDIDTSKITDMSRLFEFGTLSMFNGNISEWNVSNVTNMNHMFAYSIFNGDISNWDVSNVEDMDGMFAGSIFNGDISNWDVSNVENMNMMFCTNKKFSGDISKWDVSNVKDMKDAFFKSFLEKNPPKWYKK